MRILSVNQMYEAERKTVASGLSGASLMDAAGRACAELVQNKWPKGRIIVLSGPGNNGGDGFVAYRYLEGQNREVFLFLHGDIANLSGDAEGAAELVLDDIKAANRLLDPQSDDFFELHSDDIIVDALFGAGLNRPLDNDSERLVSFINNSEAAVLSVDIPSGLFGDSGDVSSQVVMADHTITFTALKTAHVIEPAASVCGALTVVNIGVGEDVVSEVSDDITLNRPDLWAEKMPWPQRASHKHQRGRLGVISGPSGATGAAQLAAHAGLRMGAGVVTIMGEVDAIPEMAANTQAVMTKSHSDIDGLFLSGREKTSLVYGPAAGISELTRFKVASLLQTGVPIVLDADALTVFKDDPAYLFSLIHENCVLTPHTGEFERLFPSLLSKADKINAARTAAQRAGCVVVLKGADTVIASPDGAARVNVHASPFLATAGSGDVLAGMIGGWMAQGLGAFDSASASVWIHGEASLSGGAGLISEDLMDYFPRILTRIYEEVGPQNALWERKIEIST